MSLEKIPSQLSFEGEGFEITLEIILENKEMVVDFFRDKRDIYKLLQKPSSLRPSVSLEINEMLVHDEDVDKNESDQRPMPTDELPFDPSRINEKRAEHIASFFKESPQALAEFLEYQKWYDQRA
jgi:hypothetical protein